MVNIENLKKYNEYFENAANDCNIKGMRHLRIVASHIGQLEEKRSNEGLTKQESMHLSHEQDKLSNNINKFILSCSCNKK